VASFWPTRDKFAQQMDRILRTDNQDALYGDDPGALRRSETEERTGL
jgi:hypothetical protein